MPCSSDHEEELKGSTPTKASWKLRFPFFSKPSAKKKAEEGTSAIGLPTAAQAPTNLVTRAMDTPYKSIPDLCSGSAARLGDSASGKLHTHKSSPELISGGAATHTGDYRPGNGELYGGGGRGREGEGEGGGRGRMHFSLGSRKEAMEVRSRAINRCMTVQGQWAVQWNLVALCT